MQTFSMPSNPNNIKSPIMKTLLTNIITVALGLASSQAATVRWDNVGTTLGDNLDEVSATPTTVSVPEISGLQITLHAITGTSGSQTTRLNATSDSFGINSGLTSDDTEITDRFESAFNESATFSFNQAVVISQLDLVHFDSGEEFNFAGNTIQFTDLTNTTTDLYDFSTPLSLSAGQQFTMSTSSGSIGFEAMDVVAVPEPSSLALLGLGVLSLGVFRRRLRG
jgi:hypothetical protein